MKRVKQLIMLISLSALMSISLVLSVSANPPPDSATIEPFVTNLGFGTDLVFSSEGKLYVANSLYRNIGIFDVDGSLIQNVSIPGTAPGNIEQVLGLALDPQFPSEPYLYVHYLDRFLWSNIVVRFRLEQGVTSEVLTLMDIPLPKDPDDPSDPCTDHNGGHMVFDPDGALLVGMGDNCHGELVDDLSLPQGSILRIDRFTGAGLPDNPFYDGDGPNDDRIWVKGQRNPFGIVFDPYTGRLWSTDNGPGCADEVNLIEPGLNYGWPHSSTGYFDCVDPGPEFRAPTWLWEKTIGPTGISAYTGNLNPEWQNSLFTCDWNTSTLRRLQLNSDRSDILFEEEIDVSPAKCQLDLESGPDGNLYLMDMDNIYRVASNTLWLPLMIH